MVKKSNKEIKTKLKRKPHFYVVEVFKFPNSNSIKITLESQIKVLAVCQGSFYMFHLLISPRVIVHNEYHDVLFCYRCFQLNDHVANACPKGN